MKVAPSLLAADFSNLAAELKKVKTADMLHVDIMDGVFVPNISIGPAVVAALRDKTPLPFDVHLMLLHPLPYIKAFREAGADSITFHLESADDPMQVIEAIRESGALPGLAISPDTPVAAAAPYAPYINSITVMTVQPGFGGQALIPAALDKLPVLKAAHPDLLLEVDGGVTLQNAPLIASKGADILVAGTAVFRADHPSAVIRELREDARNSVRTE